MSLKKLIKPIFASGAEVIPLVEGGKGIAASDGISSGAWAACGGIGTFSAVNPHIKGQENLTRFDSYSSKIRTERHKELIERSIIGGIEQAQIAYETSCNRGRIHMNVLWEMGSVEEVLHGILSKVKGMVHGVTCGAGMPFRLAEVCAKYGVYYYPIVSSARAFNILWKRAYSKLSDWLGGVVYEDPWLAGGHNGLSTNEDEKIIEKPYPRVKQLRDLMRNFEISDLVPIFMAGGVWWLSEWENWIDNEELGATAFQFGTRPLLTQESPIPNAWKKKLLTLREGDVVLNRFSPTGFPSSAVRNDFIIELQGRSLRQLPFSKEKNSDFECEYRTSQNTPPIFLTKEGLEKAKQFEQDGFNVTMRTPSKTIIFVAEEKKKAIINDMQNCVGCLSACRFSGWNQDEQSKVKKSHDPRSFCIHKALQNISLYEDADNELMFSGHQGYRFAEDPFYANGFVPTVKELFERILTGQ